MRYVKSGIIKVNSIWWVKNAIFQKFDFAEKAIEPFGHYGHPYAGDRDGVVGVSMSKVVIQS